MAVDSNNRINNDIFRAYTKADIMVIYSCESDKALRLLRILFQMGYCVKIGNEYYVLENKLMQFMNDMAGKHVNI